MFSSPKKISTESKIDALKNISGENQPEFLKENSQNFV